MIFPFTLVVPVATAGVPLVEARRETNNSGLLKIIITGPSIYFSIYLSIIPIYHQLSQSLLSQYIYINYLYIHIYLLFQYIYLNSQYIYIISQYIYLLSQYIYLPSLYLSIFLSIDLIDLTRYPGIYSVLQSGW